MVTGEMKQERVNEVVSVLLKDPVMQMLLKLCKTKEERLSFLAEMTQAIY